MYNCRFLTRRSAEARVYASAMARALAKTVTARSVMVHAWKTPTWPVKTTDPLVSMQKCQKTARVNPMVCFNHTTTCFRNSTKSNHSMYRWDVSEDQLLHCQHKIKFSLYKMWDVQLFTNGTLDVLCSSSKSQKDSVCRESLWVFASLVLWSACLATTTCWEYNLQCSFFN